MTATGCDAVSFLFLSGSASAGKPTYTDGDVLGRRKEPVDEHTHKGRVQAKLDLEIGELGVSHALRDDDGADGDAYA